MKTANTPTRSQPFLLWKALLMVALLTLSAAWAKGVNQTPQAFLQQAFPDGVPKPAAVWLKGKLKEDVTSLLQHPYPRLRIKYWEKDGKRVWILDEIGKEKPITTAVVTRSGQIEKLAVLAFRESRGWEVEQAFFTRQFQQARLKPDRQLSIPVDGITGATLSVRAVSKQARLALLLDQYLKEKQP